MSQKVFLISPEAPPHQFAGPGAIRQVKPGRLRIGTLDNTKGNADHLLKFIVEGVKAAVAVASVVSLRKDSFSLPAPGAIRDQLSAEADLVVSAMAD